MKNKYFVYEHWRPDKDICFYVGKGCGRRANDLRQNRSPHHRNIQAKLAKMGMCVEIRLVADAMYEAEAYALEIERIAFWRSIGVKLVNRTNGGDGSPGYKMTEDQKRRMADGHRGKKRPLITDETRQRMSEAQKNSVTPHEQKVAWGKIIGAMSFGRVHSIEVRAKMSASQKRRLELFPRSPETNAKISAALIGRKGTPHTAEHKAKMSALMSGRVLSDETRAKISAARMGKRLSEEGRAKLKASRAAKRADSGVFSR